jgi:predicted acetyltransferase
LFLRARDVGAAARKDAHPVPQRMFDRDRRRRNPGLSSRLRRMNPLQHDAARSTPSRARPRPRAHPEVPLQIRKARLADAADIARLWMHTFPGQRSFAERVRELESGGAYGGIETVQLAEVKGEVAAALKMLNMRQHVAGAPLPTMGLAAVAVAPFARRRGLAAELCGHALREARDRGDVLSGLYPFRPDFYRRLGWALTGELHVYRFRPEMLGANADTAVKLAGPRDEPGIAACYDRVAASSNGMIERGERTWRRHLDAPATHAFVHVRDGVRGYMLARYGSAPGREQRLLFVRELVAEDRAAYDDLLGWVSLQRDLWRNVRYDATPDEHFWLRLRDPRPPGFRGTRHLWDPVARIIRGPMLRIVNVAEAFTRRKRWGPAPDIEFELVVTDAQLPANTGPFTIRFTRGRAHVHARGPSMAAARARTRTRDGASAAPPAGDSPGRTGSAARLELDIGTLTQIWVGEITASAAAGAGLAQASGDVAALDALFAGEPSFRLLDEF